MKRETGCRQKDASYARSSRARAREREPERPRMGEGERTAIPTKEEQLARLPFLSFSLISITEILTFTAKAQNLQDSKMET